ncbi:unnamed protein product [Vitrella brassicaformis CCMP3155]|uniref:Golgi pH regulator conserved domain-containing protein n=1 Tax=Vitrella brassicaformis (strain CCMP3155) TaxID=1169540 RepID=A0A0G4ELY8_VITBC|nr:unnamed protein product [Vitrella brassicaformis CCMP3155]|eukprot:CEL97848.1 unnamed protein product [Vitrella brassicaformis CCMP3155]
MWHWLEFVLLVFSHTFLFVCAYWFFEKHLYRDYEVKSLHIQYIFSVTFTVSMSMLQLLMCELLDFITVGLRRWVWMLDLMLILTLIYLVIPTAIVLSVCSLYDDSGMLALVSSLIAVPLVWYLFYKSGSLFLTLPPFSLTMSHLLARVGVCGVTVVSALAAFGSINFPYRNMTAFLSPVQKKEVQEVEERLLHTLRLIGEKKTMRLMLLRGHQQNHSCDGPMAMVGYEGGRPLSPSRRGLPFGGAGLGGGAGGGDISLSAQPTKRRSGATPPTGPLPSDATSDPTDTLPQPSGFSLPSSSSSLSALNRFIRKAFASAFRRDKASIEEQRLSTEIEALEAFSRELFIGLNDLVESRSRELYARTPVGRVLDVMGWGMSAVCCYRVAMSVSNVMLRRVIQEDPASLFLSAAFGLLRVPIDVAVWSPYVSLLFLGLIIALNIRGFISKLLTVFRFVSTSVSSNVFALAMSEIMGLYFSACALLLRIYLPEQYR